MSANKSKIEKLKLLTSPAKRTHEYNNLEEAKHGLHGSPERIERFAKNRMKAQDTAELIAKERDF